MKRSIETMKILFLIRQQKKQRIDGYAEKIDNKQKIHPTTFKDDKESK